MTIMILSIILILFSLFCLLYSLKYYRQGHQYNEKIDKLNKELEIQYNYYKTNYQIIKTQCVEAQEQLDLIQNNIESNIRSQENLSQVAFENYCSILEQQYKEYEEEYNMYKDRLETSYSNRQLELMQEIDGIQKDLDQIKATRAATLQAQLKEKEIKEKRSFYCLTIKQNDLDDIEILEKMKNQLHNPRILSMLIWSTYFQKPMTALCNNVIGIEIKSGIYKITNQLNDFCYIGQSVDIARRWKDHAKCGLGIDTPQNNKLYQAMIQDGLWNFSFEILEECPQAQLNEKERYYIQLYQSYEYGYNSNAGIK